MRALQRVEGPSTALTPPPPPHQHLPHPPQPPGEAQADSTLLSLVRFNAPDLNIRRRMSRGLGCAWNVSSNCRRYFSFKRFFAS